MIRLKKRSSRGASTATWLAEAMEPRVLLSRALGIDVSSYQPTINWNQVKSSGYSFAWTKSSEGVTGNDAYYTSHINGATAAGVLIGAYHYARYDNNTAAAEVTHFLSVAGNQIKAGFLRPMLDVENPVSAGDAVNTKAEISQWVNDWCNGVYTATGVKPIVYTYVSYATSYLDSTVTQWPLWMAQYPGSPDPQGGHPSGTSPWGSSAWNIWQYSSTTPVLGIGGTGVSNQCDVDVYNGDLNALTSAMKITAPDPTVTGGGTVIAAGQASPLSFGTVVQNAAPPTLTFNVKNDGGSIMNLSGLTVPAGYTITNDLVPTLLPSASDTFTVQLATTTVGTKTGNISFTNDSLAENPFNFPVTGTVNSSGPPSAPTSLVVNAFGSNSVSLGWTDTSSNESQFLIERKTGAAGTFSQVGTSNQNIAVFVDSTAAPDTTYFYRVRATNGVNTSGYSDEASVSTLAAAPTNLVASDSTFNDHVALSWVAGVGASSYQIYRNTVNNASTASMLAQTAGVTYSDIPPSANTTYYYWVASFNSGNAIGVKTSGDAGAFDTIAPFLSSKSFQSQFGPAYLSFTFNEAVGNSIDANTLVFTNLNGADGALPIVSSRSWNAAANVEKYFLNTIPDGNFLATLTGIHDPANNSLSGSSGQSFYFLTGDANADRTVNAIDFNVLASHYGFAGVGFGGGDFTLDGTVGPADFTALSAHWAVSVPAPAAPLCAVLFGATPIRHPDAVDVIDALNDSMVV